MARQRTADRSRERATSPVIGKILAAGITLLFVGGMSATLYGGVVPGYQAAAGDELAERVLATAATTIESTPPAVDGTVESQRSVDLPATIDSEGYRIILSNRTLELVHPDRAISAETRLALPTNVTAEESTYHSGTSLVVRVEGSTDDRRLRIDDR